MSILEETPGLLEALRGDMTPKFLASRGPQGVPNVVPCVSIAPAADRPDLLFFGNFLLRKTIANLKADPRVGILVITPDLKGWLLKAEFLEFQQTGPYFDKQMSSSLLRYNAYTGIRDAGLIQVRSVEDSFAVSKMQVAADYLLAKVAALLRARSVAGGSVLPLAVRREFAKLVAVKVLAWLGDDGYPRVAPMLSLQPAGESALIGRRGSRPGPADGALVAANILTFQAVSYQVKGKWIAGGAFGAISVREAYAGGPPLPGGRLV